MTTTTARATSTAGWHDDPTGRHPYRYWDGASWTSAVSDGVTSAVDPVSTVQPEASSNRAAAAAPQATSTQSATTAGQSKIAIAAAAVIAVTLAVFVIVIFIAAIGTGPANDDSIAGTDAPAVTDAPNTTAAP